MYIMFLLQSCLIVFYYVTISTTGQLIDTATNKYIPTWESLDSRPLPPWYDEAKIGIMMHWGVYSVPTPGNEWFWAYWRGKDSEFVDYMTKNYPPNFTYQDFARDFTAEMYDPVKWAKLFERAGARYILMTSKHHDGFTLFPSTYTFGWSSADVGPYRDLIGDLANAVRQNTSMKFGVYYSLYEWYNHIYQHDKSTNFTDQQFALHKMLPEMNEVVNKYKPEVFWVDGDWEADENYFQSKEFLAWLFNSSPVKDTIVVNDRWGIGVPCKHGSFYSCEDRYNPGVLQDHKWENAMTIDKKSWGYRRVADIKDYITIEELVKTLAMTISCGGNLLMNVGPTKEGLIAPIFQERLNQIGEWLTHNGEAIYSSSTWKFQNEANNKTWYTSKPNAVYAISLEWPSKGILQLEKVAELFTSDFIEVTMLKATPFHPLLKWKLSKDKKHVNIFFPEKSLVEVQWAWVLKFENKGNFV